MELEYQVLLIDPSALDTPHHPSSPSSRTSITSRTETLSNASSNSFSSSTSSSTISTIASSASTTSSLLFSTARKNQRLPRSKSKSAPTTPRSRSESRFNDGTSQLSSILRLTGLKVLTASSYEAALALLEHRPPTEARPLLLLVDVDTELELTLSHPPGSYSTRHHRPQQKSSNTRNSGVIEPSTKSQGSGQRHLRATNDNSTAKGSQVHARRPQSKQPLQYNHDGTLCGLDFLETILQGLAKGTLNHVVPIAVSSTKSQERIMELFNLGVADVLLKPIEEQAARTLFLNVHRYSKYKTAITIPRYTTQKNTLALPSHTRLRNVFLKDQWLSDILISHYCPTPSKMSLRDFPSMSSDAALERVEELKSRLLSWDFHPHDLCEDDLMRCVVIVIQEVMKLDGLGDLNIPEHLLHRFVIGLRDSYHRSNPYHNFAHAVDVLQATFYFLCRMGKLPETGFGFPPFPLTNGGDHGSEPESPESSVTIPTNAPYADQGDGLPPFSIQDYLRPEDIFALVVASIGHDVGHPGVNNMFLVNAHTPLAQVYNDRSVLESFHSMALFHVMKKHGFECFDVDSQNRKFMEFRKMVVSTILATDMGLHFDYVGKIKEQTERLRLRRQSGSDTLKPNQASIEEQERLVLCGTLIKCADISNASRPFHVAERWSTVLLQEMCNQADIEKEMAVCSGSQSVPAGSTKSLANDKGMQIDSQLGFIHGFAMPLFSSVKEIIPEMGYCVEYLQINHAIWQERKTEYLKHGKTSVFAGLDINNNGNSNGIHTAGDSGHSEDEYQAPITKKATPVNHNGKHRNMTGKQPLEISVLKSGVNTRSTVSRKPQQPKLSGSEEQKSSPDGAVLTPVKLQASSSRRTPSSNSINSNGGTASDSSSSIPRLRTKSKAMTPENGCVAEPRRQDSYRASSVHQQQYQNNGRPRPPSSRVRTSTPAISISVPMSSTSPESKSNTAYTSPKIQQQHQVNGDRRLNSPGRQSSAPGHSKHDKVKDKPFPLEMMKSVDNIQLDESPDPLVSETPSPTEQAVAVADELTDVQTPVTIISTTSITAVSACDSP